MVNNYEKLANDGASAQTLASLFLKEYYKDKPIIFPINPFQILTDLGIPFMLRPFKKYEGVYIPSSSDGDTPIIGINLSSIITRQRYTAAHELCHHLKDAHNSFACTSNPHSAIELYAENFASELLMPSDEFKKQVELRTKNGFLCLDDVLTIANYFGVSFKACLNKAAYQLHVIEGDTSPIELKRIAKDYKPLNKKKEFGLHDTKLYEQLLNAIGDNFKLFPNKYMCQKFKAEYIFYDSRMEGVEINEETAGDIVSDLRINKQQSPFCREENKNIVEVAGLSLAYDYAFENAETEITIYDAKHLNEKLYSTSPFPEYGGLYRQSNTLVLGAKFETIDYKKIPEEMYFLDQDISKLMKSFNKLSYSEYIEEVIKIHHHLTVIHAFRDGNGRTSRAFCNMMLMKHHIPPIFFKGKLKTEYKDSLAVADAKGEYDPLYEVFFKAILISHAALSDNIF